MTLVATNPSCCCCCVVAFPSSLSPLAWLLPCHGVVFITVAWSGPSCHRCHHRRRPLLLSLSPPCHRRGLAVTPHRHCDLAWPLFLLLPCCCRCRRLPA